VSRAARLLIAVACVLGPATALADDPQAAPAPPPARGPLFRSAQDPPGTPAPAATPAPRISFALAYVRADACPDQGDLQEEIAAHVGYDAVAATAPRRVEVTIGREAGAFVARWQLREGGGLWVHPPMVDADCRRLVATLGLSIATKLDPFPQAGAAPAAAPTVTVVVSPPPATPPVMPAFAPPAPPAVADHVDPAPAPARARPRVRVGVGAAVQQGSEPSVTAGLTAQVGVRWPYVSVSAEARVDVPVSASTPVAHASDAQISAMLAGGSLVPCGHLPLPSPLDRSNLSGCGVLTLGAFWGHGEGVADMPKTGTFAPTGAAGFFAAAGGRVALEIAVGGPVALRISGDLLGTLRPATVLISSQSVWTMPRVTGAVGFGAVADF
jgi:hypothetical protein